MRGQAHTVEAFVAAVLIVGGLVFATQATAVTPLSASTSNQHIENQQEATVEGLLATAEREGMLQEAVLFWDPDEEEFQGVPDQGTYAAGPPNDFGEALNKTLLERQIAFNIDVHYAEPDGGVGTESMVRMGEPSDNAVAATRALGVYDSSELTSDGYEGEQLDGTEFYADDIDDNSELYTVIEVEVVVWRK
ncbi:uncharacterized protein NP_4016A [Natronomonas pharaonis DSM 2160]|uniref:Uncharacterized protein n=1 Tax=Natronomonas pharaonis (strain ATCC 35678 / DSM 2160 / CIP 103997 / JCM 8858 / NBRC 14720 / NCIMB 2260 / Gabara) TaxID=348780 RepID=A0A1U7EY24_NATPD|nr:hypothetical protein [Natronomonas pharaonis]CAI50099.1 uncharacterized protein NP_4016A [Natronomonas pharaonis DSM 2160]